MVEMNLHLRRRLVGGAALCVLAASAAAAQAQTAPRVNDVATSSEVVVTANKRAERLQDVAMSVSSVSGADLARTQTLDLQDLQTMVPGLVIQSTGGLFQKIIIRGENSGGDGATVASLMDDVPLSFSGANTDGGLLASDFDTYDLQRVEVLRGPQGTLYGATAEGGLIKYVTNPPNLNAFHAGFEAGGYGVDHGGFGGDVKGYVNVPLLDGKLAVRASGFYESLPGFLSNSLIGDSKANRGGKIGGRVSILYKPTEDLTIRGTFFGQDKKIDDTDQLRVLGSTSPGHEADLVAGYDNPGYVNDVVKNRISLYAVDVEYNLHFARLSSITSYGIVHETFQYDAPSFAGLISSLAGEDAYAYDHQTNALAKFNQEFRISSEPDNQLFGHAFEWQVGAFYTDERVTFHQVYDDRAYPSNVQLTSSFAGIPLGNLFTGYVPSAYRDLAGYADGTFHFTPKFDVELGGRVSRNEQHSQSTLSGALEELEGAPYSNSFPAIKTSETVGTYSVAPRYHITPDIIAYARIASGFRPGGPQIPIPGEPAGVPTQFQSDSTVNYEAGFKGTLLDKKISFDVDGFYIDWTRIQIEQQIIVGGQAYNVTGNAGKAVSQGAEWKFAYTPISGLDIGWLGAYTDAHLTAGAPGLGANSGDDLTFVPNFTSNISIQYEWLLGDARPFIGANAVYTGRRASAYGPTQYELKDYTTCNIQMGVREGRYTVELYGKNLTDARGVTDYAGVGAYGGYGYASIIRPLTVGIRLTADY